MPSATSGVLGADQRAKLKPAVQRAAGPDPHQRARPQFDQLLDHDGRAGRPHARGLDGEQLAVAGAARVSPQPARVVEHERLLQDRLGHGQRPVGIAGEQHPLGQRRLRLQMDRPAHGRNIDSDPMPERPEIPDALREAVERTMQATVETRGKAQGAVDDLTGSVDELVKGAEKGLTARRRSVRAAVEERLPATQEDIRDLRSELRKIGRQLAAIEQRLDEPPAARKKPAAKRKPAAKSRPAAKKRPSGKNS